VGLDHRKTSTMAEPCAFCDIIAGRSAARVVAEWPTGVAFFPLRPATVGHTLVVPRRHVPDIWAADRRLGAQLLVHVLDMAHVLRRALQPGGLNVINSSGEVATQTVKHLHVHLVPRYDDDAMGPIWPRGDVVDEASTRDAAVAVRAELQGRGEK
jgi:histidine triad (HIT) family protein